MRVRWTSEAARDRRTIRDHIAADSPRAAAAVDELFSAAATKLASFPQTGRAGTIPGTRELVPLESYRLVYEIAGDTVWILAVVHTARQWPPMRE